MSKQHWSPKNPASRTTRSLASPFRPSWSKSTVTNYHSNLPSKSSAPPATGDHTKKTSHWKKKLPLFEEVRRVILNGPFLRFSKQVIFATRKSQQTQPGTKRYPKRSSNFSRSSKGSLSKGSFASQLTTRSPRPLPSTYSTEREKENHRLKSAFIGDMLVPRGVFCSIDVNCACSYWCSCWLESHYQLQKVMKFLWSQNICKWQKWISHTSTSNSWLGDYLLGFLIYLTHLLAYGHLDIIIPSDEQQRAVTAPALSRLSILDPEIFNKRTWFQVFRDIDLRWSHLNPARSAIK